MNFMNTKRLKELAEALREISGMPGRSTSEAIHKILRLIAMCPWLENPELKNCNRRKKNGNKRTR